MSQTKLLFKNNGLSCYQNYDEGFSVEFNYPDNLVTVFDLRGNVAGRIVTDNDEMSQLESEIKSGESPDGWEDGTGNTIRI